MYRGAWRIDNYCVQRMRLAVLLQRRKQSFLTIKAPSLQANHTILARRHQQKNKPKRSAWLRGASRNQCKCNWFWLRHQKSLRKLNYVKPVLR
jgi:hypothetical protein